MYRLPRSHPVTMHPHGVLYNKSSEGAPYNDGTSGDDKKDDAVLPGEEVTYHWHVPDRVGPGPSDPSSLMWMYHSHTDETRDTFAGLFGPIIVYPRKCVCGTVAGGVANSLCGTWVYLLLLIEVHAS